MASFLVDTFTDSDDTGLGSHAPDVGGGDWIEGDNTEPVITGNRVRGNNEFNAWWYNDETAPVADYEVEVVIRRVADTAGAACGIVLRAVSGGGFLIRYVNDDQTFRLGLITSATNYSSVVSVAQSLSVGNNLTFIARVQGTVLSLIVGGTVVGTLDDSTYSAAGGIGVQFRRVGSSSAGLHIDSIDARTIDTGETLDIADATHGQASESLALVQESVLSIAGVSQSQTVDSLSLVPASTLTINDASHGHAAESLVLIQGYLLAIADTLHGHAAEALSLTQANLLDIADALHGQLADTLALLTADTLVIADANHAQMADTLALIQAYLLVIADALHAQSAGTLTLTTENVLGIASTLHLHIAEELLLVQKSQLVILDALHAQIADILALIHTGVSASIVLTEFIAELTGALSLLIIGNEPPADELVRYQIFDSETMELVDDSGWITWEAGGYSFVGLDPYTCYVYRYAFFSELGYISFDFGQERYLDAIQISEGRLIVGMAQLHTEVRSERGGRIEQDVEVYYSEFDRRGGGI